MMQLKFLLFSAVCCCLLEAMLCELPPSAMFRPKFSRQMSSPSISTSSPFSSVETDDLFKQLDKLPRSQTMVSTSSTSSSIANQEQPTAALPVTENPAPADETPAETIDDEETLDEEFSDNDTTEETPSPGTSSKKSTSPKKKSSKRSKNKANPNDPLNIKDLNELKERAKVLFRNLLSDQNANKAVTFMAKNVKDLLENKVASNIIATHTKLIKDTLKNEEAKEIIKDFRLDVWKTFVNPETPKKVEYALDKSKQCLSRENLPDLLRRRFKILKKILKNPKTYPAMVSVKNAVLKFIRSSDIKTKIADGFTMLGYAIKFEPDNIMKSLTGLSFFDK